MENKTNITNKEREIINKIVSKFDGTNEVKITGIILELKDEELINYALNELAMKKLDLFTTKRKK